MILSGERIIAAPVDRTLSALADVRAVGEASGLVDDFDAACGDTVCVRVAPRLNLGAAAMTLRLRAAPVGEHGFDIVGEGSGGEHVMRAQGALRLSEAAAGTLITWHADVVVMGVLAAVGQRALPWIIRDHVDTALDAVEAAATRS